LTTAIADHTASHLLLLVVSILVTIPVMLRLVLFPLSEIRLTVSVVRWRWSLIAILTLIIVLETFRITRFPGVFCVKSVKKLSASS
jgi:hypothetical protein